MRALLVGSVVSTLAACSSTPDNTGPIPEGDWNVTLTFTTGNCSGLPATTGIEFSIAESSGVFAFAVEAGLTGDMISSGSTIVCDTNTCTLGLFDTGPGDENVNISTQTITATLTQDTANNVTGGGQDQFTLTDSTMCTQSFTGQGSVAN